MTIIATFVFGFVSSFPSFAGPTPLPKSWDKGFSIQVSSAEGMKEPSVDLTFTYDSCKLVQTQDRQEKVTAFALTAAQRQQILDQLRRFHLDQLRRSDIVTVSLDMGPKSICYKAEETTCVSDSGTYTIRPEDGTNFSNAYAYLCGFARSKGKMK